MDQLHQLFTYRKIVNFFFHHEFNLVRESVLASIGSSLLLIAVANILFILVLRFFYINLFVFCVCSLENWYYRILILMTGNLPNAEIAVDALSIW
jgi:hypothetical protein